MTADKKEKDWEEKPHLAVSAALGIAGVFVICALVWISTG